jgi:hypothetical protein
MIDGLYLGDLDVSIYGEKSRNPGTFSLFDRPRDREITNTSVHWSITEPWAPYQTLTTPDLSRVFKEIKQSGWYTGNSMAFIFRRDPGNPLGSHRRVFANERRRINAARLVIEYIPPSYWGADTLDDKQQNYCTDANNHPYGCPAGTEEEPLNFYAGKIGSGLYTLEQWWNPLGCGGKLTEPEIKRYLKPGTREFTEPNPPNPAVSKYAYWYLRDTVCFPSYNTVIHELRFSERHDWCETNLTNDRSPEAMYGCMQARAFLDTYYSEVLLRGDNNTGYTTEYYEELPGNTLFIDIENPICDNGRRAWDEHDKQINNSVLQGYLYGIQAGLVERGSEKNIGIYTSPSAWKAFDKNLNFPENLPNGGIVVWQAFYHLGAFPPLDTITDYAPRLFGDTKYDLGDWAPIVWQFSGDPGEDFNIAVQDPAKGFMPRSRSGH